MNSIKLSICIPTYNRATFLRECLEHCATQLRFDFPYEIVVSDNASPDNTAEIVQEFIERGAPIQYYRGIENVGMIPNMSSALRLGRGEYVLYLADDDRLIAHEVANIVDFLDHNEKVVACHAPWYMTAPGMPDMLFYNIEKSTVFPRHNFAPIFNFMITNHIFPEIAIYRSSELRSAWVPREYCFFPFAMLAHFLDRGDIAFSQHPFYKQTMRDSHSQGGSQLAMTAWDQYRGGLEYFLQFGAKRGAVNMSRSDRAQQEQTCRAFTMSRMSVAVRLLLGIRQYVKCYELMMRMEFGDAGDDGELAKIRAGLAGPVALQTLALQVSGTAGVQRLVLSGFPDNALLIDRLGQVGLPERIEVVCDPEEHPADFLKSTAILVAETDQRKQFVDMGYVPNLVFSQPELFQTILI